MSAGLVDLSRRAAVVSGSTRGIGLAIACMLGAPGARVALHGRAPAQVADRLAARAAEGLGREERAGLFLAPAPPTPSDGSSTRSTAA